MSDGNWITGGQDKDGLPVAAVSRGDDFTKWDSVLIPYHPDLEPRFAETTVWAFDNEVMAAALCTYLAVRLPELKQLKLEDNTGELTIELVFDEDYQKQVAVEFTHLH